MRVHIPKDFSFYPQDSDSASRSTGYIYNSDLYKTGKLYWKDSQNDHGSIHASIDGAGDLYPMVDVDNSSRIIKYVVLRSDRHTDYAMPDMRIHDINVVADLNAHDPTVVNPCDVELDGTAEGIVTDNDMDGVDSETPDAAANFLRGIWNGPWPVLTLSILASASTILLQLTIDLLWNTEILQIGLVEWILTLFGFDLDGFMYEVTLLQGILDTIIVACMGIALECMVTMMMVFDHTKAINAAIAGVISWGVTAGIAWAYSERLANELNNPGAAGWFWFGLFISVLCQMLGGIALDSFASGMQPVAKKASWIFNKAGLKIPWSGDRLKFGWATIISLGLLLGLCVLRIFHYRDVFYQ